MQGEQSLDLGPSPIERSRHRTPSLDAGGCELRGNVHVDEGKRQSVAVQHPAQHVAEHLFVVQRPLQEHTPCALEWPMIQDHSVILPLANHGQPIGPQTQTDGKPPTGDAPGCYRCCQAGSWTKVASAGDGELSQPGVVPGAVVFEPRDRPQISTDHSSG